jgi:tRNA G18 (ribose-2'-O)-methylase SpoU
MGENKSRAGIAFEFIPEDGTLPYDPNAPRNTVDHLKWVKREDVMETINPDRIKLSLLLVNIERDNNVGNIIRSANTFGVEEILLYGRKKFDRRTSVGAEFFLPFRHIRFIEELDSLKDEFEVMIGLEQTDTSVNLREFEWDWDKKTLLVVGHEGLGLPEEVLEMCDQTLEIEQFGTTRSLNVSVAVGIALYDYRLKF